MGIGYGDEIRDRKHSRDWQSLINVIYVQYIMKLNAGLRNHAKCFDYFIVSVLGSEVLVQPTSNIYEVCETGFATCSVGAFSPEKQESWSKNVRLCLSDN